MMGQRENMTQELESNIAVHPKASESLSEDPKCGHLASENHKMDSVGLAAGTIEPNKVNGDQNVEKKLSSTEYRLERVAEVESSYDQIYENFDVEKIDQPDLESPKALSTSKNLEAASQNGPKNENVGMTSGGTLANSGNGILKSMQADEVGGSGHVCSEDRESSGQLRKRNTKSKVPVTSSWALRSKSQEKTKTMELNDSMKKGHTNQEKKRRGRKKMPMKKNNVNEFSRTRTHLRYLLHRIKYEQSLIDAYSAEGWKGQSLEKLKPERELQRAKSHIIRYQLKIRALFQHLDQLLAAGKLPASLFDSQGEIDSEDIFCAKCGSKDLTLDNDIILCDGACERGFHQFCLEPPLLKEDIPPGDEGWLCTGCDCKVDCIDMLKDFQGAKITVTDSWEKIFPDAAAAASGNKLVDGSGSASASDDSEDDDYDPDKPDNDKKVVEDESSSESSDECSYYSASDDLAPFHNNDKSLELLSDSEDDDFDPSAVDQDKQVKEDILSSDFTSDSEDLGVLLEDDTAPDADSGKIYPPSDQRPPSTRSKEDNSKVGRKKRQSLTDEISYLLEAGGEPVSGRRQVERLDYKTLNDETYGNSSPESSDEDFDDPTRKRTNHEKALVLSPNKTPVTKRMTYADDETPKDSEHLSKRTRKHGDWVENESSKDGSCSMGTKKSVYKRLGEAVTQRLSASFNKSQYPDRSAKEHLAKELRLTIRQVSKWFENARWSFNHRPRMESTSTEKPPEPQPNTRADNTNKQLQELSAYAVEETDAEHLNTTAIEENPEMVKSRKRKFKTKQAVYNGKTEDWNVSVDTQSPRLRRIRRTRSGNSVV